MLSAKLQLAGFVSREGKKYNTEVWTNTKTGKEFIMVKQSGNYPESVVLDIIAQAGLTSEQFCEL
jgi:hypothetical protein